MSSVQAADSLVTTPRGSAFAGDGGGPTTRRKARAPRPRSAIVALSILPLLLLLLLGVVYSLLGARSDTRWARHTDEVRVDLLRLQSDLVDAETGQRGYLATGDALFLEPYGRGTRDWRAVFDELRGLTVDNPGQERWLGDLEPVIETQARRDAQGRGCSWTGSVGGRARPVALQRQGGDGRPGSPAEASRRTSPASRNLE